MLCYQKILLSCSVKLYLGGNFSAEIIIVRRELQVVTLFVGVAAEFAVQVVVVHLEDLSMGLTLTLWSLAFTFSFSTLD